MEHRADTLQIGQPVLGRLKELALHEREDTGVFISVEHASPSVLKAFLDSLDLWRRLYAEKSAAVQDKDKVGQLIDLLVPDVPATPTQLKQARMMAKAKRAVLESGDWVTAQHIAELAELSAANPSAQPSKWKRDGRIFAIRQGGIDYFPLYGLDETANHRPLPVLKNILSVLSTSKDGWAMAYWFMSVNGWLGGKRPQDLLRTEPARVLVAAQEEVAGITHG
jgi:hypothetical protein